MRKKVFSVALTCSILATLTAATAYAQMPGTALRATIPFDFIVRGKTLPAGNYEIRRLTDDPVELKISSVNATNERALFNTVPVAERQISSRAELVFHRYGESYFLSEVVVGGAQTARELLPSRQEQTLRREMASNKTDP